MAVRLGADGPNLLGGHLGTFFQHECMKHVCVKAAPSYFVDFWALCSFLSFILPVGMGCTDPNLSRSVQFGASAWGSEGLRVVHEDCPGPPAVAHSKGLMGTGGHGSAEAGAAARRCWHLGALGRRSTPSRFLQSCGSFHHLSIQVRPPGKSVTVPQSA